MTFIPTHSVSFASSRTPQLEGLELLPEENYVEEVEHEERNGEIREVIVTKSYEGKALIDLSDHVVYDVLRYRLYDKHSKELIGHVKASPVIGFNESITKNVHLGKFEGNSFLYLKEDRVFEPYKGKGYSTLLIDYAKREAKKNNLDKIILWASTILQSHSGIIHKKLGFNMCNKDLDNKLNEVITKLNGKAVIGSPNNDYYEFNSNLMFMNVGL